MSVAALLACAAGLGLWLGTNSGLPGETEIIEAQAARYAAETGRPMTDCAARPVGIDGVRLVVTCQSADGSGDAWQVAVDDWGNPVAVDGNAPGPRT